MRAKSSGYTMSSEPGAGDCASCHIHRKHLPELCPGRILGEEALDDVFERKVERLHEAWLDMHEGASGNVDKHRTL